MGSLESQPQWHPQPMYHLKAPRGWMNDPCAPGYDPQTGTYHLFYQWNPKSCDWGDICWGHFTSKDGLHWQHNTDSPVLVPSLPYDRKGIFTGCLYLSGPKGERDQLTVVYSSIEHLPIHWTIPYKRNCAGLALATSGDGGRTWEKAVVNPILQGEPEHLNVTGFRDPFLAEWPSMDEIRGERSLYGIVSGGVVDKGPDAFLYAVGPNDLMTWTYIGPLTDLSAAYQRPTQWTGDFGLNWECVNFMTLRDGVQKLEVLIMGTEGGHRRDAKVNDQDPHGVWAMWMAGSLKQTENGPRMYHELGGILDNGSFYAANSYEHPETGTRVVWGWIKEEELTLARRESKGWTGYLSLQRELFLFSKTDVVRTLKTPLSDIPSFKVKDDLSGRKAKTIQTLGIRPLRELSKLRLRKPMRWSNFSISNESWHLTTTRFTHWEISAVIDVPQGCRRVGFHIHQSNDSTQQTSISFSPENEEIVVDRSRSNREPDIEKGLLKGPFTLLVCEENGAEVMEKLHLRIFGDGDVLEIFANDRFSLSTTTYADRKCCAGISCFAEGPESGAVVIDSVEFWDGLSNIRDVPTAAK